MFNRDLNSYHNCIFLYTKILQEIGKIIWDYMGLHKITRNTRDYIDYIRIQKITRIHARLLGTTQNYMEKCTPENNSG